MAAEQHNRRKVSIRNLPVELHDKIVENIAMPSDLRACALTLRVWRYGAQKVLHRDVKATGRNFALVLPRYTTPASGDKLAMNLSRFPRSLTLQECRGGFCFGSKELAEFARHCGAHIESLKIDGCMITNVRDLFIDVASFPSLKELHFLNSDWLSELRRFDGPPPPPPATLERVSLVCLYVESAIARWLAQTPALKISTAHWTCNPLHEEAAADSSAFFREIGRSLTHLSLQIDTNQVNYSSESAPIDLSMNTCLSQLKVKPLGHYVPGQLPQILSTLNSPVLERIQLSLGEDWRSPEGYKEEIDPVVKVLLQSGKFSGLKTVAVYAPNNLRRSRLQCLLSDLSEAGIEVEILGFGESEADDDDEPLDIPALLASWNARLRELLGETGEYLPLLSELGEIADGEPEQD